MDIELKDSVTITQVEGKKREVTSITIHIEKGKEGIDSIFISPPSHHKPYKSQGQQHQMSTTSNHLPAWWCCKTHWKLTHYLNILDTSLTFCYSSFLYWL